MEAVTVEGSAHRRDFIFEISEAVTKTLSNKRRAGTLKRIIHERGFGFVSREGKSDLFFHASSCPYRVFELLKPGDQITYEEGTGKRGSGVERPAAINVRMEY